MANQLTKVVMQNILKKSGKDKGNTEGPTSNNLSKKEEKILLNVMYKNVKKKGNKDINRVTLEDLTRKNNLARKDKDYGKTKKSNTMLTLKDLASKANNQSNKTEVKNDYKNREKLKVKKSSLNSYIPKVSLNSIGKNNSLK
ncbi:hypothetical protein [Thermohalobacter berrensis]|uniref:Uncharacterized protein n=1 Tax=Thermohalobacter berrensis TaxID=99594 RepID=A0A419T2K5_9FIRM|nr:hypothetical protein [Thermohalobacter berrensis]RKD31659.1 hypothetical protein BET03_12225 [Thermohalobacter berrensis]